MQKRRFITIFICIITICVLAFSGCTLNQFSWDINDGFDEEDYIEPDYDFTVTSTLSKINISLSNIGDIGENASLVATKPYEYLYGESTNGLSEHTNANPLFIDTYECGTEQAFEIDRFCFDGYDGIYLKYYVLNSTDEILAGPMHCTEITPKYDYEEVIKPIGIKGVMCEDRYAEQVSDLGCEYTLLNFVIDGMIVPNEIYNSQTKQIEQLVYEESTNNAGELVITRNGISEIVEKFIYNNSVYYFRKYGPIVSLDHYDKIIAKYTNEGIKVTLIILMHNVDDKLIQPYYLTYPATKGSSKYVQINTSNEYGASYWGAFMEFLSDHYSKEGKKDIYSYGLVETFVLGNEIDMSSSWNNIVGSGQASLTLENYVEEYEREMRIANQAIKKYYSKNKILVSLTHAWQSKIEEYSPKGILDYMTKKTLSEGNYDYGFAIHPYGINLASPTFWSTDLSSDGMTGSLNTSCITWSNLEVIQLYLEQSSKRYNGEIRSVYLTEGGVSSSKEGSGEVFELTKNQQCAGIAYIYYKCTQLSCVKALIYYRLVDSQYEGANFGLYTQNAMLQKPAYKVYKYIDTQYSFEVSKQYLKYITWSVSDGWSTISYGVDCGNVNTYLDTMALFRSKFDWKSHWDESKIIIRQIDDYV